jgi:hypothetical protein
MNFWTIGANEGQFCDTAMVYSWCNVGKLVSKQEISIKWVNTTKAPAINETCLSLQLKDAEFALQHSKCGADKLSFVCEVRIISHFIQKPNYFLAKLWKSDMSSKLSARCNNNECV